MHRLRQVLTISFLLLFSAENLVNISVDAVAQSGTVQVQVSAPRENFTLFSWISEENENNEERNDDKCHGFITDLAPVSRSLFAFHQDAKTSIHPLDIIPTFGSQRILRIACQLLI